MLCLYPHHGALNPPNKGPIVFPSLYRFLFRLWFIECASQPETTWAIAKHTIERSAFLVKHAVRNVMVTKEIKQNYLTQLGSYRCLTFSYNLMYLLVSLEVYDLPTCLNDMSIFSASSECKDLNITDICT